MYHSAVVHALLHFIRVIGGLPAVAYTSEVSRAVILRGDGLPAALHGPLVPYGAPHCNVAVGLHIKILIDMPAPLLAGRDTVAVYAKVKFFKSSHFLSP